MYIDDIIIFSKSEADHENDLGNIFKTLEPANMKVQLDKCTFFEKEVEYLGFIVTSKIKAIQDFPTKPQRTKIILSPIGLLPSLR